MTTQTPTPPTDNERLSRLEGVVEQLVERVGDIQTQLNVQHAENNAAHDSLRSLFITLLLTGMGIMWATMVGGFIAILTFNS